MKNTLLSLLLLVMATTMNAQTIVKGDMNGDNDVTVADVTAVVDVALGKLTKETINVSSSPFTVDNSYVVGTWYATDGTHFTFNDDGTTDFPGGSTYRFYPGQSRLLILNASNLAVRVFPIVEATPSYLLVVDYATGVPIYYTNSASLVSSLTLSEASLTIKPGSTAQLTATVTPSDALNTSVTWTSSNADVATVDASGLVSAVAGGSCTITCTAQDGSGVSVSCEVTVNQLVTSITLSQTSLSLNSGDTQTLTATISPSDATNKGVTWSSSNTSVATVNSSGLVAAVGTGTCTITATAKDGSGVSAICNVRIIVPHDPNDNVNLGLPSGTLWATCNIGADNPEDYGDYFAWGETSGYNDGKTTFNWSTYKWCNGSYNTLTKYCHNSSYGYNGFTDTLTELEPDDDAAYVNWGSAWRIPSLAQMQELRTKCTWTWTTQNDKNGYNVVGPNGNSIFLPAAGCLLNSSSIKGMGVVARYWSRMINEYYDPYDAWYLYCVSDYVECYYDTSRGSGLSVRPVRNQ